MLHILHGKQGLLFIPDISGSTGFITETDIEDSHLIIQDLLTSYHYSQDKLEFSEKNRKNNSFTYYTIDILGEKKSRLTLDYYIHNINNTGNKMNIWMILLTGICVLILSNTHAQNFSYKKTAEGVEVSENNKPVLFYQFKQKTVDGKYARAGYVHPLYNLDGGILTEDSPEDHPYHRGIFWAWHQIIANGKRVGDGWMSDSISFDPGKMQVTKSGKNAIISAQLTWRSKNNGYTPENLVNETTRINIYAAKDDYRIVDFDITLKPLVEELKLGGSEDPKGYGGFCWRIKLPDDMQFISGIESVTPQETAVNAGPWMQFNTGSTGIVIFGYKGDESNTSYPWILRKAKSMQNVPYPGRNAIVVPKEGLHLQYRMIIYRNALSKDKISSLYKEWNK